MTRMRMEKGYMMTAGAGLLGDIMFLFFEMAAAGRNARVQQM